MLILLALLAAGILFLIKNPESLKSFLAHPAFDVSRYYGAPLRSTTPTLVVEDVKITKQKKTLHDRIESLLVTGQLLNMSPQSVAAPAIKVSAYASCQDLPVKALIANFFKPYSRNAGQCLHHRWKQPLKAEQLKPYEKVTFAFTIPENQWPDAQLVVHP